MQFRRLKVQHQDGLSKPLRGSLLHAFPPAPGTQQEPMAFLTAVKHQSLPLSSRSLLLVALGLQRGPQSCWLGTHLLQFHLAINYIRRDPISKEGHILVLGLGLQLIYFMKGTIQPKIPLCWFFFSIFISFIWLCPWDLHYIMWHLWSWCTDSLAVAWAQWSQQAGT